MKIFSSNFKESNKLIIIAHPDDEMIFFGGRLLKENGWFVLCLTNRSNIIRSKEFKILMNKLKVPSEILDFNDGEGFSLQYESIKSEIEKFINRKKWDLIITHNHIGEYGHSNHIITNKAVLEIKKQQYSVHVSANNEDLFQEANKLSESLLFKKRKMIKKYYKSQSFVLTKYDKYIRYEKLILLE